jgi:hypothetical protein
MTLSLRFLLAALLLFTVAGCSKSGSNPAAHGGHTHVAPHGGVLVALGDHAYNLELVRDAGAGKLTAYLLDGHAENFVRLSVPSFDLVAIYGGEKRTLAMKAVANPATGETVGNTSQFESEADWLKKASEFPASIPVLEIKGTKFSNVALHFSAK